MPSLPFFSEASGGDGFRGSGFDSLFGGAGFGDSLLGGGLGLGAGAGRGAGVSRLGGGSYFLGDSFLGGCGCGCVLNGGDGRVFRSTGGSGLRSGVVGVVGLGIGRGT